MTVIEAAKPAGLYAPVVVAVTTGVRRGELLALRWSDIDLNGSTLTVNQSLERIRGKYVFKAPKTKKSRRTISLPSKTIKALREHYTAQLEQRLRLGLGRDPRGLVFARPDGEPMDADALSKSFGRLVRLTKVTPITLHGLRHTHISHLLMDGVHVKVVSERRRPCQRNHHAECLRGLRTEHAGRCGCLGGRVASLEARTNPPGRGPVGIGWEFGE
jgi:integrase